MAQPWHTLERIESGAGPMELRRRGEDDYLIALRGRVLMNSRAHRSEVALAEMACRDLADRCEPRILLGGLGMGFTLRAALDHLPPDARVEVDEINPAVIRWCRGPIAHLSREALADPRVRVEIADVASTIARSAGAAGGGRGRTPHAALFDAILLDLYQGPSADTDAAGDPLYGASALDRSRAALGAGGVFAVWSESPCARFEQRARAAGFEGAWVRPQRGGKRHAVYIGRAS